MDFFLKALKHSPVPAIAAFVFYSLLNKFLESDSIWIESPAISGLILFLIFIFCLSILLVFRDKKEGGSVKNNVIAENEVGRSLNVGNSGQDVISNRIEKNKVKGDLNVGGK